MDSFKKLAFVLFCFCLTFVFSACSLKKSGTTSSTSTSVQEQTGSFIKSPDGGRHWENKVKIDEASSIGLVDILSMAVDPANGDIVCIGTEKGGLFMTKDEGENWEKLDFPLTKIYGLAIDKNDDKVIYASGVLDKRAKIYKSTDQGKNWTQIYTEPVNDSIISSLAISEKNPKILYGGTSEGMIFKSTNSGNSWRNLMKVNGPVVNIAFDSANDNTVYFGVFKGTVLRTLDGGGKIEDLEKLNLGKISDGKLSSFNAYSIVADPKDSGTLYVGTDSGIFKGTESGAKWEEINILESSKKFPVRAIAINPQNPSEIFYSNSGVIYRSLDGGKSWLTFQLTTDKTVSVIKYDPQNPSIIYAGLRKV